jgi:glycerophosphoryl diester phosphodiesterase
MSRTYGALILGASILVFASSIPAAEPAIVAHRGLAMHAPENTLSNFRACLELRLGFEFDVRRTKYGQLVCMHDDTVDRTTNGKGRTADLSLAEIAALDAGAWFDPKFAGEKAPSIEAVLALLAEYRQAPVLVAVDLKGEEVEVDVVRLAEKYQVLHKLLFIGRTIEVSAVRRAIRTASKSAHIAVLAQKPENLAAALVEPDADWAYVRFVPTADDVAAARKAKKKIFIAGVTVAGHLPEAWRRAAASGVDGILTDYPLELRGALKPMKNP